MGKTKIKTLDETPVEEVKVVKKAGKKEYNLPQIEGIDEVETKDIKEIKAKETEVQKTVKTQKPGKAKPRSKKYKEAVKDLDRGSIYQIPQAIEMVKKTSYSKFPGSLEIHINTKQSGIRGLVSLPFMAGRRLKILAFGPSTGPGQVDLGEDVTAGDDKKIDEISKGKIDFDILITTPQWMVKLAKVAKVLGPKGLMPNPKNNTITDDLKKAVESLQAGKTEFKTESKAAVIHLALGKLNQPDEELIENTKTLLSAIGKSRVKKAVVAPTMGPSFKIDTAKI